MTNHTALKGRVSFPDLNVDRIESTHGAAIARRECSATKVALQTPRLARPSGSEYSYNITTLSDVCVLVRSLR